MNDKYPALVKKALRIVIRFATSYLCVAGYLTMTGIKTQYGNE